MTSYCEPLSAPPLGDPNDPKYAVGRKACRFIERYCRFGQGDRYGQPVRLEPFQKAMLLRLYEIRPDGSRRYRRAHLELPKGNGKTAIVACVVAEELVSRPSATVPVGAASYEQAGLLFDDVRDCIKQSPALSDALEVFEGEIQVKDGPGRAYKVAAVAGTNDGQRPTLFVADELHEWVGNKERVHLVIANGCAKREGSLQLSITTPGWDPSSLAAGLHDYGVKVNSGEVDDPEFLFIWYGCPDDRFDLDDPDGLRAAVRAANPAADAFLNVESVAARYRQMPRHEFLRYHLGLWTTVAESWLPTGAWEALQSDDGLDDLEQVVLGLDGSYNNDATAIVACSVAKPHRLEVIGAWERPADPRLAEDYSVPILDVEETVRRTCARFAVREIACDLYKFQRSAQLLEEEGFPIVAFPQTPSRMTPATSAFEEAVLNEGLTHSGDERLARHIANAVLKVDARGRRITKDAKGSPRKIDLAIAAVMAFDRAAAQKPKRKVRLITNSEIERLREERDARLEAERRAAQEESS